MTAFRWPVIVFGLVLLVPTASRSIAYQTQDADGAKTGSTELKLTPAEEKDSYEIYSLLLKAEMPTTGNPSWIISQETTTYPGESTKICLDPIEEQKAQYVPVINDYLKRNKRKLTLVRKFDLPSYVLLGHNPGSNRPHFDSPTLFYLSAVGFNSDRTRGLVYVGYVCGSLCGAGAYHLMVKKDGRWQEDVDYRGPTCWWRS